MKTFSEIYADFIGTSKMKLKDELEARGSKLDASGRAVCDVMIKAVMKADGMISGGEAAIIEEKLKVVGSNISLEEVKDAVLSTTDGEVAQAKQDFKALSDESKETIIFCLLVVSSSDGVIAKDEYNLIKSFMA